MKIHIVMAQRKCKYPGEYGPELLAGMTEYEYSDNPEYLEDKLMTSKDGGEFEAVKMITLTVDDNAITEALFPKEEPIPATVDHPKLVRVTSMPTGFVKTFSKEPCLQIR